MIRSAALMATALMAAACAREAPPAYTVAQTALEVGGNHGSLPALAVRRGDGAEIDRDDWELAQAAVRDHCAGLGTTYDPLPPARDYTQIRLEDGVLYFMGRCGA
jgi:hypothetical protein